MSEGHADQPEIGIQKSTRVDSNGASGISSAADLANTARFKFRTEELDIPEVGARIQLKSLSVREREELPRLTQLEETDDEGKRTEQAIKNVAKVFSVIVSEPKVTAEQAEAFLGGWPAEAIDRVMVAYGEMAATGEEEKAAAASFPAQR